MSIHGPAFRGGIVGDGVLLSITLGGEAIWGNTLVDQFSHNTVGSLPRELKIPLSAANIVGIAGDLGTDIWINPQIPGNLRLLCHSHRDSAILGATFRSGVICHRKLIAISLGLETISGNAKRD